MINVATVVLIREKNGDEVSVELFRSQINFTWPNFPISSSNYHRFFGRMYGRLVVVHDRFIIIFEDVQGQVETL